MTCIVALTDKINNVSYIGGERGASDEMLIWKMAHPKIWRDKGYLFGFAGVFAIEKLKHNFDPPPPPSNANDEQMDSFMNTTFIDALSSVYEEMHIDKNENGGLIIVVNHRIFVHNSEDMSVTMVDSEYLSDGSGSGYALGSLYTSRDWENNETRINVAISAANNFSPSCGGKIDILSTEGWDWEAEL